MHRLTLLFGLLLSACSICVYVLAQRKPSTELAPPVDPAKQVQGDVETLVRGVSRGDVDTQLRYTHPKVLELVGGVEKAKLAVAQAAQRIANARITIESFSFPQPPQFFEGGGRKFVLVPTLTITNANGHRVETLNFQFGVLEPGTTEWKYLEGSKISPETAPSLFPGFPRGKQFPPIHIKRL
jgi:hypothetical protein